MEIILAILIGIGMFWGFLGTLYQQGRGGK